MSTRPPEADATARPRTSRAPALRRLADQMLEAGSLDALARLLTEGLPRALGIERSALLVWNRKLDSFEAFTPGEPGLAKVGPEGPLAVAVPEAGFLVSDGALLRTHEAGAEGVLVPLMARSGVVGMLVLGARAGRRRMPFRPTEVRLLSILASRAALALENHLYQKELISSERMAALGAMAGMLAHDFRNPMTVVRGHAEMLLQEGLSPGDVRAQAEVIIRMVDRLDRMTGEILDFARAGARLVRRPVRLRRFLTGLVEDLGQELPGLSVVSDIDLPEGATAALDEDKLRRVLSNLASNARDAMGGAGRVHLSARLLPPGPEGGPGRVALELADEGPGVPPEIRPRLFEPFVTARKKGGTGLGLAVARRFVEDHGGTIELLPAGGEGASGARFRIAIPMAPGPPSGSEGAAR
ncbi:MAG TPA: ATP-binding protein [Vicinamibacteria bacterium]|nr:ATP-binding protein [Vicinamibacteria bacterium]